MHPHRLALIAAGLALATPMIGACQSKPDAQTETLKVEAGSSYETAIVLDNATDEYSGIRAEHAYTEKHFPTFNWAHQNLANKDGRIYDIIELTDGQETRTLYFDITGWFGKL